MWKSSGKAGGETSIWMKERKSDSHILDEKERKWQPVRVDVNEERKNNENELNELYRKIKIEKHVDQEPK